MIDDNLRAHTCPPRQLQCTHSCTPATHTGYHCSYCYGYMTQGRPKHPLAVSNCLPKLMTSGPLGPFRSPLLSSRPSRRAAAQLTAEKEAPQSTMPTKGWGLAAVGLVTRMPHTPAWPWSKHTRAFVTQYVAVLCMRPKVHKHAPVCICNSTSQLITLSGAMLRVGQGVWLVTCCAGSHENSKLQNGEAVPTLALQVHPEVPCAKKFRPT
jgi:hypothetical protein